MGPRSFFALAWGHRRTTWSSPPPQARPSIRATSEGRSPGPRKRGSRRWKPYELRHSCTSLLSAAGVPLEQIADILGHRGVRMTAEVHRHRIDPVIDGGVEAMETLLGDGST